MMLLINTKRLIDSLRPETKTHRGWTWEKAGIEKVYGKFRYKFHVRYKTMKHRRTLGLVLSSFNRYTDKQLAEYMIDQYIIFEETNEISKRLPVTIEG